MPLLQCQITANIAVNRNLEIIALKKFKRFVDDSHASIKTREQSLLFETS